MLAFPLQVHQLSTIFGPRSSASRESVQVERKTSLYFRVCQGCASSLLKTAAAAWAFWCQLLQTRSCLRPPPKTFRPFMIASDVSHNLLFARRQIRCFWKQTDFEGWVNFWVHWLLKHFNSWLLLVSVSKGHVIFCVLTHIVTINRIPDENSLSCHIKNYWKREEYFVYSLMQNLDRKCTKNSVMVSDASGICTLFLPSHHKFYWKFW